MIYSKFSELKNPSTPIDTSTLTIIGIVTNIEVSKPTANPGKYCRNFAIYDECNVSMRGRIFYKGQLPEPQLHDGDAIILYRPKLSDKGNGEIHFSITDGASTPENYVIISPHEYLSSPTLCRSPSRTGILISPLQYCDGDIITKMCNISIRGDVKLSTSPYRKQLREVTTHDRDTVDVIARIVGVKRSDTITIMIWDGTECVSSSPSSSTWQYITPVPRYGGMVMAMTTRESCKLLENVKIGSWYLFRSMIINKRNENGTVVVTLDITMRSSTSEIHKTQITDLLEAYNNMCSSNNLEPFVPDFGARQSDGGRIRLNQYPGLNATGLTLVTIPILVPTCNKCTDYRRHDAFSSIRDVLECSTVPNVFRIAARVAEFSPCDVREFVVPRSAVGGGGDTFALSLHLYDDTNARIWVHVVGDDAEVFLSDINPHQISSPSSSKWYGSLDNLMSRLCYPDAYIECCCRVYSIGDGGDVRYQIFGTALANYI